MSTLVMSVTWIQNSIFGGYVAGDYLEIYWNDSTLVFEVYENSILITSGTDIPYGIFDDYKQEIVYQSSICNGTSLLNFNRKSTFPYLFTIELQNHPSCSITPVVCDLQFDSLPISTPASGAGSLDGTITVSASGSNGSVKYRLNSSFEYNDGTGQSSGAFTGLGVGNYLIYARDEINCLATISVTVGLSITYGTIYQLEFYDERIHNHHKTEILQKGYSGDIIEVKGTGTPSVLSLRGEKSKDKFISILPSEMIFSIISETEGQYHSLFTNNPEQFRMRHSIDTGSGYEIVWIGKVIPYQYEERYIAPPYEVNVVAVDGLNLLKDTPLLDDENNQITGSYSQISLIAWILKKIGFNINIRSGINLYADSMSSGDTNDPLAQAFVDVGRYYLINDVPNCWDVLRYNLEPYGAQIILYNNVWNIIRVEERIGDFDYREYDSDGVYVSNSSYSPVKNLSPPTYPLQNLVWMNRNQIQNINRGYGTLRLLYNMGLKKNILPNGDFNIKKYSVYQANVYGNPITIQGTIPDLTGFQLINNGTVINTTVEDLGSGNIAIQLISNDPSGYLESDEITLKSGAGQQIKIHLKFKVSHDYISAHYTKIKLRVTYGIYYLLSDGTWSTSSSFITYYVKREDVNQYIDYELIVEPPTPSYYTGESFNIQLFIANPIDYDYTTVASLKAELVASLPEGTRTEIYLSSILSICYYELKNNTDADDDFTIIRPSDYNATTNPYQWILVSQAVSNAPVVCTLSVDHITIRILANSKALPEVASLKRLMEDENSLFLDRIIYHGSLVYSGDSIFSFGLSPTEQQLAGTNPLTGGLSYYYLKSFIGTVQFNVNSADIVYAGYLRDSSGVGFDYWARDGVNELATLQEIYAEMQASQYFKSWRSITGDITGGILLSPIDTINETFDSNKKYIPVGMEIDFRNNAYTSNSLLELNDFTDTAGNVSAAFTTGFSLGFKS